MDKSTYSRSKLARYIADQLKAGAKADKLADSVSSYLIEVGKTADLNSLLRDIVEESARQNGRLEVTAVSAFPLTDSEKKEIERLGREHYPSTRKVTIHNELDPELIGGVRVLFPHDQLDLSVRTKLNNLARAR